MYGIFFFGVHYIRIHSCYFSVKQLKGVSVILFLSNLELLAQLLKRRVLKWESVKKKSGCVGNVASFNIVLSSKARSEFKDLYLWNVADNCVVFFFL